MRNLTRTTVLLASLLTLSANCFAQESDAQPVVIVNHESPVVGRAKASHSEYKNETRVFVSLGKVSKDKYGGIEMSASFVVPGKEIIQPGVVYFEFSAVAHNPTLAGGGLELVAEVGEKSFKLGPLQSRSVDFKRHLSQAVSFQEFEQIATGNAVRVRLGKTVLVLSKEQVAALKDLIKAIGR